MSRIGRQPIPVPSGVNIAIDPGRVMVNGPLGELTQQIPVRMTVERAVLAPVGRARDEQLGVLAVDDDVARLALLERAARPADAHDLGLDRHLDAARGPAVS